MFFDFDDTLFDTDDGINRRFMLKIIKDKHYKPHKHPEIDGRYVAQQSLGDYRRGDTIDSYDGWVHGVWSDGELLMFSDKRYFLPDKPYTM
jgi:FMN phosphatase YigB (HAD superfamily)